MHNSYSDIRSLTKKEPLWWDENGVPRYAKHHPSLCPDIYADKVILMEIACQSCKKHFFVQMSSSFFQKTRLQGKGLPHYGDPPNISCCAGGATMNCDDLRIVEYWDRRDNQLNKWKRCSEKEK